MKFVRLFIILSFAAVFPSLAIACACSSAAPGQCPTLQQTDVVFTGTVISAQLVPTAAMQEAAPAESNPENLPPSAVSNAAPTWRFHFHIDERFAGPEDQTEIDVFSGGDDGDCGYKFQIGQKYVVYTQQEAQGLFATICNGTRSFDDATALIPQLRAMRDGRRVASVFGVLRRSDPPFLSPPDDPADPISSVSLKLHSKLDRFQTDSGQDGVFSFYDVHEGTYEVTADLPPGTELTRKQQDAPLSAFSIPDGACYEYDVYALPTGHISGTVLGPDGKPLQIASLELFRAGAYDGQHPGYWGFQGAKGVFDFDHVGPGEYILVYNRPDRRDPNSPFPRAFYPGVASIDQAKSITLKDGQILQKIKFKVLNGFDSRTIRVKLKFDGPRPLGTITVAAKADKYENPAVTKLEDGSFSFTIFDDANYAISAWEDLTPGRSAPAPRGKKACSLPPRIQADPVTVAGSDKATKEITLTLPKPTCIN